MELIMKNIKEVSLVTNYNYGDVDKYYTDLLRVSDGWVSYERTSINSKRIIASWSYRFEDNHVYDNYYNLLSELIEKIKNQEAPLVKKNQSNYNIRVTFIDNSKMDISRDGSFGDNDMRQLAIRFINLIPRDFPYPNLLMKDYFITNKFTREIFNNIDKEKIVAIMYAEGGAMGIPGHTELIDEDNNRYTSDPFFEDVEVDQIEIVALLEGYTHIDGFASHDILWFENNYKEWVYFNLGAGNHLLLRKDFYRLFGDKIMYVRQPNRYRSWIKISKGE